MFARGPDHGVLFSLLFATSVSDPSVVLDLGNHYLP